VQVQIGFVVLMLAAAGRFSALGRAANQHQMDLARAYVALAYNPAADQEGIKILCPDPASLRVW
jgi:hypothetical protein